MVAPGALYSTRHMRKALTNTTAAITMLRIDRRSSPCSPDLRL